MSQVLLAAGGTWQLVWCVAVVFVAYALRGATGFGAGVVSIPLLLLALPIEMVIPLVTAMGMIASFGQVLHQRQWIDWRALRRLLFPSVLGVGVGLWLFAALDPILLRRGLALFIIAYAVSGILPPRSGRPVPPWLAPLAGALGGFVATLFGGMAGPFYVVYLRSLALDKSHFRATVAVALLCLAGLRALGYGGLGFYDVAVLWLLGGMLPVVGLAMIVGDRWHARLDEARFSRAVAVLLALSGAALLFK